MMREHLWRYITPPILLGLGVAAIGIAAHQASLQHSKLKVDATSTGQHEVQTSVGTGSNDPTLKVNGTEVPIPDSGHVRLSLDGGNSADVNVDNDSDNSGDGNSGESDSSVHVNVTSSDNTNTHTRTSVHNSSRNTSSTDANLKIHVSGTGSAQVNQ